jgi:hypothetical protein
MSLKSQEAITAIHSMTKDEIDQAIIAIKHRQQYLARNMSRQLRVGDTVSFAARGRTVLGQVIKVNQKNVKVREGFTTWNVNASLLTHELVTA